MAATHTPPESLPDAGTGRRRRPWLQVLAGLALGGLVFWLALRTVDPEELRGALASVDPVWVLAGLAIIVVTTLVKAWRWQLLYYPSWPPPPLSSLFWATVLGQFVNLVLRVGELARIYAVEQSTPHIKARSAGTLVVEKTLDAFMIGLLAVVVTPFVVLPSYVAGYLPTLLAVTGVAAGALYLVAYRSEWVLAGFRRLARWLPGPIGERLTGLFSAGLLGLSALRSRRQTFVLLAVSGALALLGVLTPLVLFPALDLPYGLREAAVLHTALSIGMTPPSTPAKVGVFEWIAIWLLTRLFGLQSDALALSYALVFHLVVLLPQLVLGVVAALRFRWQDLVKRPVAASSEDIDV